MLCPECGAGVTPGYSHCPWCGQDLKTPEPHERAHKRPLNAEEDAFIGPLFRFPPLTLAILATNILLYLLMEFSGGSKDPLTLLIFGAKLRAPILHGEYWRLLFANFLHIGFWHLLVNSITLIQLGMICENIYGRTRFFVLYLVTGICGFLASMLLSDALSAGASASLAGLMGATLAFGWRHASSIPRSFRPHFTWYLLPWVGIMIGFGLIYGGVDNLAHIGGLLSGLLLGLLLQSQLLSPRRLKIGFPVAAASGLLLLFSLHSIYRAYMSIGPQLELVEVQRKDRDPAGQVEVLSRFIDRDPDSGLYYGLRGTANYRSKRFDAAEADYRDALRLGYDEADIKNQLAWLLTIVPNPAPLQLREAVSLARDAVQLERAPAYLNTLGWALYLQGDLEAAARQLEAAIREGGESPERVIDHFILAMILHRQGKAARAQEHFDQGVRYTKELEDDSGEVALFKEKAAAALADPPH